MGATLAVILANLWLKQYKPALSRDIPEMFIPENKIKMEYVSSAIKRSHTGRQVWNLNAV